MTFASPMSDVEVQMSIQPIEELLRERDVLVGKVATLRAKFGAFGTWEALRKIELARLRGLIRAQALRDKRKISNDAIDDEAHGHPDYADFVTLGTNQRAEWVKLESLIEGIDFTINRGQSVARFVTSAAYTP
jgi:hypothetical protein